jgi:hypothetical protein
MADVTLRVRQTPRQGWIQNFSQYGWKVKYQGSWIQLGPWNTKVRSADNTTWLNVK